MNNIEDIKGGTDGQTCRRKLKRTAIVVFENLLAKQFFRQSSLMFGKHICLTQSCILLFTSDFSSFKVNKDVKLVF